MNYENWQHGSMLYAEDYFLGRVQYQLLKR